MTEMTFLFAFQLIS